MARVLDIPLYDKNIAKACEHVIAQVQSAKGTESRCISATGAHGIVYAQKNPAFKNVLKSFYLNLPDGMPGVWIGRMKGAREMKRCYGPDFFKALLINSSNTAINHFFCGGNPGIADELKEAVKNKFHNERVVGTFCPPYVSVDEYDYRDIAERIELSKADIVWIGLSTPKQELFASKLSQFTKGKFIITIGAAFDFHTDRVRQAPRWMQRAGLEWFFRLMMEPKRLYKRYFTIVPLFILYNLQELITFATRKLFNKK